MGGAPATQQSLQGDRHTRTPGIFLRNRRITTRQAARLGILKYVGCGLGVWFVNGTQKKFCSPDPQGYPQSWGARKGRIPAGHCGLQEGTFHTQSRLYYFTVMWANVSLWAPAPPPSILTSFKYQLWVAEDRVDISRVWDLSYTGEFWVTWSAQWTQLHQVMN